MPEERRPTRRPAGSKAARCRPTLVVRGFASRACSLEQRRYATRRFEASLVEPKLNGHGHDYSHRFSAHERGLIFPLADRVQGGLVEQGD
jgi:hypothetical protein